MSSLALSDSFEYLYDGSTAIRNIVYSYSAGIDFRRLTTKVDPRAVKVNHRIRFFIILSAHFKY